MRWLGSETTAMTGSPAVRCSDGLDRALAPAVGAADRICGRDQRRQFDSCPLVQCEKFR
jgi:hypothetical protein